MTNPKSQIQNETACLSYKNYSEDAMSLRLTTLHENG